MGCEDGIPVDARGCHFELYDGEEYYYPCGIVAGEPAAESEDV
jgi:hypothetical protein